MMATDAVHLNSDATENCCFATRRSSYLSALAKGRPSLDSKSLLTYCSDSTSAYSALMGCSAHVLRSLDL